MPTTTKAIMSSVVITGRRMQSSGRLTVQDSRKGLGTYNALVRSPCSGLLSRRPARRPHLDLRAVVETELAVDDDLFARGKTGRDHRLRADRTIKRDSSGLDRRVRF